ncbi:MAG: alanine--tRNA ligase [Candidatus Geothermarchaeota archaeon]
MSFKIDAHEFDIEFMKAHGYTRKQCKVCKAFFWTIDGDRETCGEPPCDAYSFLKNPPTKRKYTVTEMRREFLNFFEKRNHEVINPYPVVARWRDDLLITIASIADFQPYFTSGLAEPPANPLVISQPCLRFEDIDKVGLTAGRHLSIFEMGGHHAFNNTLKNKYVYWKNETLEFHNEFATKVLGIPEEEIVFKEHFWIGGGNAGPDVEGIIRGLEVSTLVFMMYELRGDTLVKIPVLTVDTGYGIERWTWLSTGYPTAFHAIYDQFLEWAINRLGIKLDNEILYKNTLYSPLYEPQSPQVIYSLRSKIAKEHGLNLDELNAIITLFEDVALILDHSKSAIFLIKDGAIPSNVKEGYLTRLLLRRIFRKAAAHKIDFSFIIDVFARQIDFWSKDFSEIKEVEETVIEIVEGEYKRFNEVIRKIPSIIRRYEKGKEKLTLDDLMEIYDSYGISPELIVEYLEGIKGYRIEVPSDFYKRVSERHIRREIKGVEVKPVEKMKYVTKELYYINQYWSSFNGRILEVIDGNKVILDKTVFYPGGGGQLPDRGHITVNGSTYEVIDVVKENDLILHILDKNLDPSSKGRVVYGQLDWSRRLSLMCHHTAAHLLLAAAKKILGPHIWQAGAEKRPEIAHIDVTHHKLPSKEDLDKIEKFINTVVSLNVPVNISYLSRGSAEKEYGVRIYQGGIVPGDKIRIVRIGDIDVQACGGLHVKSTGELKLVKIVNVEKVRDGVIRFYFVAGDRALNLVSDSLAKLESIAEMFHVDKLEVANYIRKVIDTKNKIEEQLKNLKLEYNKLLAEKLYLTGQYVDKLIKVIPFEGDIEDVIKMKEILSEKYNDIVFLGLSKYEKGANVTIYVGEGVRSLNISAYELGLEALKPWIIGAKGNEKYARFGLSSRIEIEQLSKRIIEAITRRISSLK